MFRRSITLNNNYSFFLFGPRGVGKTTLLKTLFPPQNTQYYDLLDFGLEEKLVAQPGRFSQMIDSLGADIRWVIIDEVQRLPWVLNEVHRQIEKNKQRFFCLTGSSARKLKRGQANLLAGRAFVYHLHPLTPAELADRFDLNETLEVGTLPKIYDFQNRGDKKQFLNAYAQTYLREEVFSEGIVRRLPEFRKFLIVAAQQNGQLINWSNIARDVGVDAKTVQSYFQILEDTLVGTLLYPYAKSIRKQQHKHPKFYFFDTGIKRALSGELEHDLAAGSDEFGRAFEHFCYLEIVRRNDYLRKDYRLSFFSTPDTEIDLMIERGGQDLIFVEIKSTDQVREGQIRPLNKIVGEVKKSRGIVLCRENLPRKVSGNVTVYPWLKGIDAIFGFEKR